MQLWLDEAMGCIALASTNSRLMRNWGFDQKKDHKFEHHLFGIRVFARQLIKIPNPSKLVLNFVLNFVLSVSRGESISSHGSQNEEGTSQFSSPASRWHVVDRSASVDKNGIQEAVPLGGAVPHGVLSNNWCVQSKSVHSSWFACLMW